MGKGSRDEKGIQRSFLATFCLVPLVGWRWKQVRMGRGSGQGERRSSIRRLG